MNAIARVAPDRRPTIRAALLLTSTLLVLLTGEACVPYTVASTAQTLAPGHRERTTSMYIMPRAVDVLGDSVGAPITGVDVQWRFGLNERSDIGVRVPSFSGVVVDMKRRLAGQAHADSAAVALIAGGGIVNWGEHAHAELSLIASSRRMSGTVTPYGGVRVMQVAPLSRVAVHDSPTAGGFMGLRLGSSDGGVSPELGVFYDRSALGLRERNWVIVPSISVHGDVLGRLVGWW